MFTWEEAGLLRQMLLAAFWIVLGLAVATGVVLFRRPIADAVERAVHHADSRPVPLPPSR